MLGRNEWMYEKFASPEALINYCNEQKEYELLKHIQIAIQTSKYVADEL